MRHFKQNLSYYLDKYGSDFLDKCLLYKTARISGTNRYVSLIAFDSKNREFTCQEGEVVRNFHYYELDDFVL
jgi:hypothetical protein